MPWKEWSVVGERLKFVARRLVARPWRNCAEVRNPRKTGYKIFDRYQECGFRG